MCKHAWRYWNTINGMVWILECILLCILVICWHSSNEQCGLLKVLMCVPFSLVRHALRALSEVGSYCFYALFNYPFLLLGMH